MKINKVFSISIVVVAIVLAFNKNTFAQAKYFPGYVIMLTGDTLKGETRNVLSTILRKQHFVKKKVLKSRLLILQKLKSTA